MTYEWQNMVTGEIRETDDYDVPPVSDGNWRRVYSIHFLAVKGAGDSPGGYVRHTPRR